MRHGPRLSAVMIATLRPFAAFVMLAWSPAFAQTICHAPPCHSPSVAAITRVETRIAAGRGIARGERATGNAAQYLASVFNFAPTWDQFHLKLELDQRGAPSICARLAQGCPPKLDGQAWKALTRRARTGFLDQ
jgi:hypothetical protein